MAGNGSMTAPEIQFGVVLKVVDACDAEGAPAIGLYLKSLDYTALGGIGVMAFCERWTDAHRFSSEDAAADFVVEISPVLPEINGKRYRPALDRFAFTFVRVGAHLDQAGPSASHHGATLH